MNNILFLGASKGCGKTTIVNALYRLLDKKGHKIDKFQVDGGVIGNTISQLGCECGGVIIEGIGDGADGMTADASLILIGDIEKGGVFAGLYGTYTLLKGLHISGFLINKFRGDAAILEPGLKFLKDETGVPVLGVIPYVKSPDEFATAFKENVDLDAIFRMLGVEI